MLTLAEIKKRLRQPDDLDTPVWRYMNVGRFLWLLLQRQLWLAPLNSFSDTFEGVAPHTVRHALSSEFKPETYGFAAETDAMAALRAIRQNVFVSCWHLGPTESDVMWRSYCSEEGIVIRTTYRRLRDSVGGLPVGLVDYADFSTYRGEYDPVLGAWLKRSEFSGDREIRVGYFSGWFKNSPLWPPSDDNRRTYGMPIAWPISRAIDIVHAHPKADYDYVVTLEEIARRIAPDLPNPLVAYSKLASSADY